MIERKISKKKKRGKWRRPQTESDRQSAEKQQLTYNSQDIPLELRIHEACAPEECAGPRRVKVFKHGCEV